MLTLNITDGPRHTAVFTYVQKENNFFTFTCSSTARVVWGTTDGFTTSFLHFSLFFTALWDVASSRPVHSLMLSSHLFFCLPCLLPPFTVPHEMGLARPDERETCTYHCSWRLFTTVRRLSCSLIACWTWEQTRW